MRQVLRNLKTGALEIAEVPSPVSRTGMLLIQSSATLISPGTERMLVEFGKASLLQKAHSQPDKVRQVLEKMKTDGLIPTLEVVFSRLDEPMPLGYCNSGRDLKVGVGGMIIIVGNRVVCNGKRAAMLRVPVWEQFEKATKMN